MTNGEIETLVRQCALEAKVADLGTWAESHRVPRCTVQASFLRRLILGLETVGKPHLVALKVRGAVIQGVLDLVDCVGPEGGSLPALVLEDCVLPERLDLSGASIARFSISDSRFCEVWAVGTKVDGEFAFQRTRPVGEANDANGTAYIRLRRARIGGDVNGRGTTCLVAPVADHPFSPRKVDALELQGAEIGGALLLDHKFSARGGVWLMSARIAGNVSCYNASFLNPGGVAIAADGAAIGGDMFLSGGFRAEGRTSLLGARIGGRFDCSGGNFYNSASSDVAFHGVEVESLPENAAISSEVLNRIGNFDAGAFDQLDGIAIQATSTSIGGSVYLRRGFSSKGEVLFAGTRIERDLELHGATLASLGWAFALTGAHVAGELKAENNSVAGDVTLAGTRLGGLLDDPETAWGASGKLLSRGLVYEHISALMNSTRPAWRARATWLKRNALDPATSTFSNQPWRQAAKTFERMGLTEDSRRLSRMEQCEANRWRAKWKRPFYEIFANQAFGYGLSAMRAFITCLVLWLIGWGGTEIALSRGVLGKEINGSYRRCADEITPPLYALDFLLPVLKLGEADKCRPERIPGVSLRRGMPSPFGKYLLFDELAMWRWARAIFAVVCAIAVGVSILTWSGVFRPKGGSE